MNHPPLSTDQLLEHLALGEDSQRQFRRNLHHADTLAAELVAFSNSGGGHLFIGVSDEGQICALDPSEVRRIHQLLSDTASQQVHPPIQLVTHNLATAQGLVVHVRVADGLSKPHLDALGRIWVKQGASKRHITARAEMLRMFQRAGLVYVDAMPVLGSSCADIDEPALRQYLMRHHASATPEGQHLAQLPLELALQRLGLGDGGEPNLSGLLLFGRQPQRWRPVCGIKAVAFPGTSITDTRYLDSQDIGGTLQQQYTEALAFIKRNLRRVQGEQGFNSPGVLEIAEIALQELLVNALVHRDYLASASIRIAVLADRVEIISPGHLPDGLSLDAVRQGQAHRRNPTLSEHAFRLLPYRGMGSGIPRALEQWPHTTLHNDSTGQQFSAVLPRPKPQWAPAPEDVAPASRATTGQVTRQDAVQETGQDTVQDKVQVARQDARQVAVQVKKPMARQEVRRATAPVLLLLGVLAEGELSRKELMEKLQLKGRDNFEKLYLSPALEAQLAARTIPDKPNSRLQKYRITEAGLQQLARTGSAGS